MNNGCVECRCTLRDSFVKSLACIKFLQMIVIFPESPQTFTWGGEAKINYSYSEYFLYDLGPVDMNPGQ